MSKVQYPCKGGPGGSCPSLCCFQAADALKAIVDLKLSGQPVDPAIFDFPYKVDQETGKCENVMDDGGCAVYLNRPLLCNIEAAGKAMGLDPLIFQVSNAEQCNVSMITHGIPQELLIDTEKYRNDLIDEWVKARHTSVPNEHAVYPKTPDESFPPTKEQ